MLTRFLRAEVVLLSALGIAGLVVAVAGRFLFPWPLEWMEGVTLHHALRLLEDEPVYGPPTAEFIALLYPPLSYLPIAASVAVFGDSLPAARLPSLLALAGTLFFIGRATAKAGGGRLGGLLAAGLWGIGYGYGGAFLDIARVDAFFLLLVVAGTERLQSGRPRTALALFALSFFAKQHGLLFLVAASLWLARRDLLRHLAGLVGAWGALAFLYVAIHLGSDGWFTTYVVSVPQSHGVIWRFVPAYLLVDVLLPLPVLGFAAFVAAGRRWRNPRPVDALLLAGLAASALGRAHVGGFDNVRLPGFALLVVVGAATLAPTLLSADRRPGLRLLLGAALAVQFVFLFQSPSLYWPTPGTARGFRAVVRTLEECASGGDSVALDHALLTRTPYMHTMALSDLREGGDTWLARKGTRALLRGLAGREAPGAIAVGASFQELDEALARRYRLCDVVAAPRFATGYQPPRMAVYSRAEE